MKLSQFELDCIRFYMGDPEIVDRGDFLGGAKAYNTINALLHEGIVNELDKIKENKPIEIYSQMHLKQIATVILTIDHAMNKCSFENSPCVMYRVDRLSEADAMLKEKRIEGFYSTCKYGYLEEYAKTKQNLVLMEIRRDKDVPILDFEELFQSSYAKKEEAEILLPYDSEVKKIQFAECTDDEKKQYLDMNGNPPCKKVIVHLGKRKEMIQKRELVELDELAGFENAERISRILKRLTQVHALSKEDEQFYLNWKKKLKQFLMQSQ